MPKPEEGFTDFGFQKIPRLDKTKRVQEVFQSVASQYDFMNDLMSFGIHRIWKKIAISKCFARPGQTILDLAGGTGDMTQRLLPIVGPKGKVILADINASMLQVARARFIDANQFTTLQICQTNAETLPFQDNIFDSIIIAFGLRNITDKAKALRSMYRTLKPGGRLVILEFSKPRLFLQEMYDFYSFNILPWLGKIVLQDSVSYQYLAESIRMHPNQDNLIKLMQEAEFEQCSYQNLTQGIVAIHTGFKF